MAGISCRQDHKQDNKDNGFAPTPTNRLKYQRGVEAVLWSMPAVSDIFFRESLYKDFELKAGDVAIAFTKLNSKQELLTPNSQVNYSIMGYDMQNGPFIVEIPASSDQYSIMGTFTDAWQVTVSLIGIYGPDEGKGAKYLLIPPGYDKPIDTKGYIPIQMSTYTGMVVYRPVYSNGGTEDGAVKLAAQTKGYPYKEASNPPQNKIADISAGVWHSLPVYDLEWFVELHKFIQREPIREQDKIMIGMLGTLGIEKGKEFNPSEEEKTILKAAVKDAYEIMQAAFLDSDENGSFEKYWPTANWSKMNMKHAEKMGSGLSYDFNDGLWTYERAIAPYFWANYVPLTDYSRPPDPLYLETLRDKDGNLLSGKHTYRLTVPAKVPVKNFWSINLYSTKTKAFVFSEDNIPVSIDSYNDKVKKNPDGSIDVYFGKELPQGQEHEGKYFIPSLGEDFFLMFRFYGPDESVHNRQFVLPNVEKVN